MSVVLDLPQKLQDAYNIIAKEQEIPKEKLMQEALEAYLEDLSIAIKGHEDRLGGDKGIEVDEFYRQLGI